jgi:hypothetical protein
MPMHVAKIHSLNRGSSSLTAIGLIVIDTEYSGVFKDSEVAIS